MPALFITAVSTDVGKTFVACALIRALRAVGRPVDAFKPVLSGYDAYAGSDAARLLEALGRDEADLDRMSPLRFVAPLAPPSAARAEGRRLALAELTALCLVAITPDSLVLIEGAGGVMSPIADGATNLDLADSLRCPVLLVTGSYLGAVSHTLSAIDVIRARRLDLACVVISESENAPPLIEITGALAAFEPGVHVVTTARAAQWDASNLLAFV